MSLMGQFDPAIGINGMSEKDSFFFFGDRFFLTIQNLPLSRKDAYSNEGLGLQNVPNAKKNSHNHTHRHTHTNIDIHYNINNVSAGKWIILTFFDQTQFNLSNEVKTNYLISYFKMYCLYLLHIFEYAYIWIQILYKYLFIFTKYSFKNVYIYMYMCICVYICICICMKALIYVWKLIEASSWCSFKDFTCWAQLRISIGFYGPI